MQELKEIETRYGLSDGNQVQLAGTAFYSYDITRHLEFMTIPNLRIPFSWRVFGNDYSYDR